MTMLSPIAQAIRDAALEAATSPPTTVAVAILHAVADQVEPLGPNGEEYMFGLRHTLSAVAAELEAAEAS